MHRTTHSPTPADRSSFPPVLQRKCDCGTHTNGHECEDCKEERKEKRGTLQRSRLDSTGRGREEDVVPPIVYDVLSSPGQPLDSRSRALFEERFDCDFSQVRVHTDARAAASAQAINAAAYTAGSHIVFTSGQYVPTASSGLQLLAHELTHVVQQRGSSARGSGALAIDPSAAQERQAAANASALAPHHSIPVAGTSGGGAALQRACLAPDKCATAVGQGAKTTAVRADPANVAKEKRRKKLCLKSPRDKKCTSDGHARRAVQLESLLRSYDRDRLTVIHGIFVDMDIPAVWGAYRQTCNAFVPPLDGTRNCIFVPDQMENEAKQFNTTQDPTIGGKDRDAWQRRTLRILMHETGHARFEQLIPDKPRAQACEFDDIRAELHEIAADLDEVEALDDLLTRSSLTRTERDAEFNDALTSRWLPRAKDNWLKIQCTCECADANEYLRRTVDTMTVDWDRRLLNRYFGELQHADPSWPIAPPGPHGPGDYPLPRGDTVPV